MRDADRVRDLDLAPVGEAGGDDVLGDVARGVRGGAVHLRRVLAGERAATVASHAAVGVDDDLAAGQAAVAHRAADLELAGRVDEEVRLGVQLLLVVQLGGQDRVQDVLPQVGLDQRLRVDARLVLGRDQDLLDLDRAAVLVADRHLGLAVGAQVRHHVAAAHLREAVRQPVRERDRHRHQLVGLARRVAEHHSLVARAGDVELVVVAGVGARLVRLVDTLRDVRRLLVDRGDDRAGVAVEAVGGVVVADPADRVARDLRHVDVGLGGDLAGDDDEARVDERLAGHAAVRVVAQDGVEHAVGDLVGHLVGVALRDGLGGEEELVVGKGLETHGIWKVKLRCREFPSRESTAPAARSFCRSSGGEITRILGQSCLLAEREKLVQVEED